MNFKPMLSASLDDVDLSTLNYPLLVSPKLDGVRCIVWEGVAYSRNAKPIRNRFVQKWASQLHNLDGELIVGSPTDPLCLNTTQSGVMSYEGWPDFTFHLFDAPERYHPSFQIALRHVQDNHADMNRIFRVPHIFISQPSQLLTYETRILEAGYEGVMLRDPDGPYKNGRSTLREGYLMKLKRFIDGEAVVVRVEEGSHNTNEATKDALGRTKRSSHKAGKVGNGMVGHIYVNDPVWGELKLSPGTMPHWTRQAFWNHDQGAPLIGKTVHWRSFGYGVKDKPRFPRFYGVREDT